MNKNRNVYLMYLIIFLQGFVFYGPIATVYRQARGLSMYNMFLIESISWILMIVFEVPWGWFADRFGYKKTIVISTFLLFISKIIFFKAYSFEMFLLERIFLSLAFAGLSGCDAALIYSSIDEKESEKVFGRYSAFSTGGFLIASLMSTVIIKKSMDAAAFWTIIPYGIAVILAFFLKDVNAARDKKPSFRSSLKVAFGNKQIIMFILSIALVREVVQSVSVFLNQPQFLRSGIDIKFFGILVAVVQVVRLSSAKAYSLSEKFGKNRSVGTTYILMTISCVVLIFTTNPVISVLGVILVSGGMAVIEPIALDIENKTITVGDRATILSIYAMVGDLVGAIINPLIGRAADVSLEAAFKACSLICVFAYFLFYFYKRKNYNAEKQFSNESFN